MLGAPIRRRAVLPAFIALVTAAVVVPGTVDAQEQTSDVRLMDQLQGNWVRVESNNPRNNGMRVIVVGTRARITAMPPRGSSRLRVGQVIWDDLSGDGSLGVRGSDGAFYPSKLTMEGSNRLQLDIDLENSPGNDQTWERAGPSIDGDWVLYRADLEQQNRGLRIRVEGDRATIRYVPATADRGYRVGDIIWREIGSSNESWIYSVESLFGGSSYESARLRVVEFNPDRTIRAISTRKVDEGAAWERYWGRPVYAEERIAAAEERERRGAEQRGNREDEEEGALLDLPREPVGDPSAQDPDLEPSEDTKTVDVPEDPTPPVPEQAEEEEPACLATSLRHDRMGLTWSWGITEPPSTEVLTSATSTWDDTSREQYEMGAALPRYSGVRAQDGLVVDVEQSRVPGLDDHHSYIWQENVGQRRWKDHRDFTASELDTRIASYRDLGFRLIDIEGYSTPAGTRYAGVWVENGEGVDWLSDFDLTSSEYGTLFRERRESGYRLVDVEAYSTPSGVRYAGIWYRSCDDTNWRQLRGMSAGEYEARVESLAALGFQVIDFESYSTSEGQRYAAIWEEIPSSRAWRIQLGRTLKQFLNHHHRNVDEGLRLMDYESYDTSNGIRYAGVWAENDPRYRWAGKEDVDALVETYRTANFLPGVSVAVIQNGDVIYRRGFGFADRKAEKWAHSETVYLAASVSKVIGATLAARLEEKGVGDLDLSNKTSGYLAGMLSHHTHSVQELLSKTACVHHYEGPEPNDANYYRWRMQALVQIWQEPLIWDVVEGKRCSPGDLYHYSTHGFTFVGAVLEAVTGKDIAQLLQDEIAQPSGLSSMRAMFTDDGKYGLPVDYHRASPYEITDRDTPPLPGVNFTIGTDYENNSWKVLGGGIETHSVDLATFGWKTLNNEIVSKSARDEMWRSRTSGLNEFITSEELLAGGGLNNNAPQVGLAWRVDVDGQRAWHGGVAPGARSFLRIWRDRDVVVAIMSNRPNDRNQRVSTLSNRIAAAVDAVTP